MPDRITRTTVPHSRHDLTKMTTAEVEALLHLLAAMEREELELLMWERLAA